MLIADILMVFAPILGYIPQYNLIKQTKSLGSFSIDICAILLLANILRIYFWFANGFGLPLLLQSILMIAAQLTLLKVCVRALNHSQDNSDPEIREIYSMQSLKEFSLFDFWRWGKYRHYLLFLTGFALAMGVITWAFLEGNSTHYGEILGFLSLSVEATLGFPQLYKNYSTRSVAGLSFILVLSWFAGDFLKTLYFIIGGEPVQFIVCGTIQLTVDIIIILQIIGYRKNVSVTVKSQANQMNDGIDGL